MVNTIGARPFSFVLRPGAGEVVFRNASLYEIFQNRVNQQVPRAIPSVMLIKGKLRHEVTPRVCDSELCSDGVTVEIQKEETQVSKALRFTRNFVIELARLRVALNRGAFLSFPTTGFQAIEGLELAGVSLIDPAQR